MIQALNNVVYMYMPNAYIFMTNIICIIFHNHIDHLLYKLWSGQ